jgi:hypothetical protein
MLKTAYSYEFRRKRHKQHSRKDMSLWDTLAHRQDHIQTHTTQHNTTQHEEGHITMGYTSAQMGSHTHNTTQQEERHITMGYTSAQTGSHTNNTTQQITMGYTSA